MGGDRDTCYLVDGMNVLGSRPDGWWRDRPAAMERLARRLEAFAERERVELTVVYDGREHARVSGAVEGIEVGFAPGGPDAADREIVRLIRADPDPAAITAVSSDRRLRNSVKAAGAQGIGAGELLRLLEASEASEAATPEGDRSGSGVGSGDGTPGADRRALDPWAGSGD